MASKRAEHEHGELLKTRELASLIKQHAGTVTNNSIPYPKSTANMLLQTSSKPHARQQSSTGNLVSTKDPPPPPTSKKPQQPASSSPSSK
jgi:hypothetical protein